MLGHLLLDFIRRHWSVYAVTGGLLALLWANAGSGGLTPSFLTALSLAAAYVLGPLLVLTQLTPAEVLVLPMTRRDLWRATWLLGVGAPAALTLVAKSVAALGAASLQRPPGFELVAVSSILDFVYAGVIIGIQPLLRVSQRGLSGRARRVVSNLLLTLAIVVFLGGIFWGFAFQAYLPTVWSELHGPMLSLVAAGMAMTIAAYFYAPPPGARPAGRGGGSGQPPAAATPAWYRPSLRLTGIRLLLVRETLGMAVVWTGMVALVVVIGWFIEPWGGIAEALRSWRMLPFSETDPSRVIFTLVIFGSIGLNSLAPAKDPSGGSAWRHLRVLPMSTDALVRLLLARRLLGWVALWAILLAIHMAATGSAPATLWPAFFLVAVGADALMYAVQVRWPRTPLGIQALAIGGAMFAVFGLVLVVPMKVLPPPYADPFMAIVGLCSLTTAAWVLRQALTLGTALYAPPDRKATLGQGFA